jgi:hypothetical protein
MRVQQLSEKAQTAVREPWKIPQWLKARSTGPARRAVTWLASPLSTQEYRLQELRQDDEWLLIVLDACRYDIFNDIASEYFEGRIERVRSAGHDTFEYVRLCWPGEYEFPYVSGATPINSQERDYDDPHFQQLYQGYVPAEHLNIVDVWDFGWDESLGTCPPEAVTDAALAQDSDRLVAHYFQPHAPYLGRASLLGHAGNEHASPHDGLPVDKPIWDDVERGRISEQELRQAYCSNLWVALTEVCRLIREVDHDRIVIMGDHGEALGEWNVYSHPRTPHPKIRTVPWIDVQGLTALGEQAAETAEPVERSRQTDGDVEERLEVLGYV